MFSKSRLGSLILGVRNPLPALLDRFGLIRRPYILHHRSGLKLELRPRTGDLFGFYEVILRNDYYPPGMTLRRGAHVIDVGANIGAFTVLSAHRLGGAGKVVAIEPEQENYDQLVRNVALNRLSNVLLIRGAVGGRDGIVRLNAAHSSLFNSTLPEVDSRQIPIKSQQVVPLFSPPTLLKLAGIEDCDFLKMDCEGSEHEFFAALTPIDAARVRLVALEIHTTHDQTPESLQQRLRSLGFSRILETSISFFSQVG